MSGWFQKTRGGALALALAGTLANCGDGGDDGGGNFLRLLFGMNGQGSCDSVIVHVDLADTDAILARDNDGSLECRLDSVLASRGCFATYTEQDGGDRLRVSISGCVIPAVTNLFACSFEDVDVSELNSGSSAQCACAVSGCDNSPPLCIDENPDPSSCEDCDNGTDDDGNGLTDCDDPNCQYVPPCGESPTTTTTTTRPGPTTTRGPTTTMEMVTTTSLPQWRISIDFRLTSSPEVLGALAFTASYSSAPGRFDGAEDSVLCDSRVGGASFARHNDETRKKLTLRWVSRGGVDAPAQLATCEFLPRRPVPVPANFTIVIDEATDEAGNPVNKRDVIIAVSVTDP